MAAQYLQSTDILQEGYLELWLGPMFSGKTTQLIQAYKKFSYIGKNVVVINYADDTRYHDTMLATHDQIMIPCVQTMCLLDVQDSMDKADVVLINEGQFFPDLYDTVLNLVDKQNKIVCICALDGDFQRNRFGRVLDLIPYCDKVIKLHSLCSHCKNGKSALFSRRITQEEGQIVIGSDNYVPLCRTCYNRLDKL